MCQRGNCSFSILKILKVCKLIAFLKTLQRLKQELEKSPALGPGKQTAKTWFGLEKQKGNQQNYKCLPLLTILPLNYFMVVRVRVRGGGIISTVHQVKLTFFNYLLSLIKFQFFVICQGSIVTPVPILLKVLSSEMDPVEIRLIRYMFINGSVAAGFQKNPPVPHRVRAL